MSAEAPWPEVARRELGVAAWPPGRLAAWPKGSGSLPGSVCENARPVERVLAYRWPVTIAHPVVHELPG